MVTKDGWANGNYTLARRRNVFVTGPKAATDVFSEMVKIEQTTPPSRHKLG